MHFTVREIMAPTCHDDGSVTYWCPRRQEFVQRQRSVPRDALAMLPDDLAERVRDHLDPTRAKPVESVRDFTRRMVRRVARQLQLPESAMYRSLDHGRRAG